MTSDTPSSHEERLAEYLRRQQATLGEGLGFGVHGSVFGKRWNDVQTILFALQQHGIYVADVNPGNIAFVEGSAPQ